MSVPMVYVRVVVPRDGADKEMLRGLEVLSGLLHTLRDQGLVKLEAYPTSYESRYNTRITFEVAAPPPIVSAVKKTAPKPKKKRVA